MSSAHQSIFVLAALCLLPSEVVCAAESRLVVETVREREVITYLPPSYDAAPQRRYPVIYLLHGGGGTPRGYIEGNYQGLNIKTTMDTLVANHIVRELIVVMPDVRVGYLGFVTDDLIAHTDATFRTLAKRESRGIAGHSRGGFAALTLAVNHPELYRAVYAMSPCCVDRDEPAAGGGVQPPLMMRVGARRASVVDLAIRFDVGTADSLLKTDQSLAEAMSTAGVPHVFETYPGDHNGVIRQRVASKLLPFFSEKLAFQ